MGRAWVGGTCATHGHGLGLLCDFLQGIGGNLLELLRQRAPELQRVQLHG